MRMLPLLVVFGMLATFIGYALAKEMTAPPAVGVHGVFPSPLAPWSARSGPHVGAGTLHESKPDPRMVVMLLGADVVGSFQPKEPSRRVGVCRG